MLRVASSLVRVVVALAALMLLLAGGLDRVTVSASSPSYTESPLTRMTRVAVAWPSAKLRVPVLPWPAPRSLASRPPPRVQVRSRLPASEPLRVTVKLTRRSPPLPSARLAASAAMAKLASSLRMRVLALPCPASTVPPCGLNSSTWSTSSASTRLSPRTRRVMVWVSLPLAAKVTVPLGRPPLLPLPSWPLAKSLVSRPVALFRRHCTEPAALLRPLRVTVKVMSVKAPWVPSACAAGALMLKLVSSSCTVVVAVAPVTRPALGLLRVRVKASLPSTRLSPASSKLTMSSDWPGAKVRVPLGRPPRVSLASPPLAPLTA